jgi:hypothetical protein
MRHMWRLSDAGPRDLGLAFTDDSLLLGETSLVERRDGCFVVRARNEIDRLLKCAYGGEVPIDWLMAGFARVASALNANDLCSAHIAAVQMRVPDLASPAVRDALAREDSLIKYARDGGASSADWNPALHPRTGTAPNPGWFASTSGTAPDAPREHVVANDDQTRRSDASPSAADDWVHLPPGDRIDELGDFLEWLANSKPEDEQKIRDGINHYWGSAGDAHALSTLNAMLSEVLKPGTTRDERQQILDLIEHYSRYDPRDTAHFYDQLFELFTLLGAGLSPRPWARLPGAEEPVSADGTRPLPVEAERPLSTDAKRPSSVEVERPLEKPASQVDQSLTEADAAVWNVGWAARGDYLEVRLGRTLHKNFPVIDKIPDGIATSIKSIDLNASTYQDTAGLTRRLVKYVGQVSEFMGDSYGGDVVRLPDIKGRALSLAVPKGSITEARKAAIEEVQRWARSLDNPVEITIDEF